MRVGLVHKRLDRLGGAEWDCFETATRLAARGHDVHLVVGDRRVPAPAGVTVHTVPVVRTGQIAKLLSFAALAPRAWRRLDADVVIGFGRTPGPDIMRASGGCHRRYLADLAREGGRRERWRQHWSPYQRALLAIERRQYRPGASRTILTVSGLARRELLETYPDVDAARVDVLPYGVDLERFQPALRARHRAAVRRELGVPEDAPVVLTVGTGFRRKGVGVLLDVWRSHAPGGATLVVVGNDQRLPAWRQAGRDSTAPVVFTGPRADVERMYAAADVFVLASVQDAFGMVVLEALACGLPVVTSRRVGAAEVLEGPLAALVVDDPRDAAALRTALAEALAATPAFADAARAAAAARGSERAAADLEGWCATVARAKRAGDG
jgi:UDP-glucose:(heptosyl)LPS alpha-1,3-glucosyltransferase